MKKKLISMLMVCLITVIISGCASDKVKSSESLQSSNETSGQANKDTETEKIQTEKETPKAEEIEMSMAAFEELLTQLPIAIISTKYVIQDDTYKSLYPDLLQTIILNNTDEDIKDAVIAIVAWDENNLPLKLMGNIDFSDGEYVKEINYSDINLIGGSTFGEGFGFGIDENVKVSSFKAIPVSFKTFDGDSWENPYYEKWKVLYEGNKFTETMIVKVVVDETQHVMSKAQNDFKNTDNVGISESELLSQLEGQDLKVMETKYTVQDEEYKSLYPDLLQVILRNDTEHDLKNAEVAFVAWDDNKLPVKIKGNFDFSDGSYVKVVDYSDINLVPGKTYGHNSGFELDEYHNINSFIAIVVSYESFEGITWKNPLFDDWKILYEGKKLQ